MNARTALAFADDRTPVGSLANAFADPLVTDDIVHDVGGHAEAVSAGRWIEPEFDATGSQPMPRPLAEQATRVAFPRVIRVAARNWDAVARSTQRFHQSSPGGQCQLGGAKQTNRFFARRQYS